MNTSGMPRVSLPAENAGRFTTCHRPLLTTVTGGRIVLAVGAVTAHRVKAAEQPSVGAHQLSITVMVTVISSRSRACSLPSRIRNRVANSSHNIRAAAHEPKSPHHLDDDFVVRT
jgi:hypothetical protein